MISFGATPFGIGVLVFCVYVLGAISQIIVGRLVDRYTLRNVFVPLSLMQAPCLLLAAYAYDWMMLIAAIGMMFAIFGQVTINDTMVAKYTSVAWRGRAYAIRYLMSFTASACAVPLIANQHQRSGNFGLTFQVLAVLGVLVFVGELIRRIYRQQKLAKVRSRCCSVASDIHDATIYRVMHFHNVTVFMILTACPRT